MKRKFFIIVPFCLMIFLGISLYFYDNNLNKSVNLVDVNGDRNNIKDIKLTSMINDNLYDFKSLELDNSSVSMKNISSTSYEKYASEIFSYNLFNKTENSDLYKYLKSKGYLYQSSSFSDGKVEGVIGLDNQYEPNEDYTLKVVTKNLESNKIDEFEFNIKKDIKSNENYGSSNISSNLKGNKLYIMISSEYYKSTSNG